MFQRLIPSGVAAAIAGGTMTVALSCCPSFAQQVYYGHPYHHPYYHPYHHPYHYNHYDNPNRVRHYVPKTNPYHHYY